MCSIAGFISKNPISPSAAKKLTQALLYFGEERGEQSAGVYIDGKLLKKAMNPWDFSCLKEFGELFEKPVSSALVHTRQPTSGGRGDEQAQPFVSGRTATIHNGWFLNIQELKRRWKIQKASGVDSELLTSFIDSYGIMKLPRFVKSASGNGAFAILYHDDLYLMRSGNPTAYTIIDFTDGNTIFIFASTAKILANAVRYVWLLPAGHPIRETKEGVLFHVSPDAIKKISGKVSCKNGFEQYYIQKYHGNYYREMYDDWKDDNSDIRWFKPERYDPDSQKTILKPDTYSD